MRVGSHPLAGDGVRLTVHAAALHAPHSVPRGDGLECFVVAGHAAPLVLSTRDVFHNVYPHAGREWAASLEVLARDASVWRRAAFISLWIAPGWISEGPPRRVA